MRPFPTACATSPARKRHTMLDLSVGATSALRTTNVVEWVFAPLTKQRVQPTPLWSVRRSASSSGQLLSVLELEALAVELVPSVWSLGSTWRSQPASCMLKTNARPVKWTGASVRCMIKTDYRYLLFVDNWLLIIDDH